MRTGRETDVLTPLAVDVEGFRIGIAAIVHSRKRHRGHHHLACLELRAGQLDVVADQAHPVRDGEATHRFIDIARD